MEESRVTLLRSEVQLLPPKREKKKVIFVLPVDQIKLLDDCAELVGIDRSAFLAVYIDSFAEGFHTFVQGWRIGMQHYAERLAEEKTAKETAEKVSRLTGQNLTVSKSKPRRRGRPSIG